MTEPRSETLAPAAPEEPDEFPLGQRLAAEALGTFVLVLFGVGAAKMSGGDYVATGLSFGLAITVMVYAVGRVSGGHFNPAVSVGAAISGRFSWREAGLYALTQLGGALGAGFVLWVLLHGFDGFESTSDGMGQNSFGGFAGYAWWAAFLLELVMTAVFVTVILGVTDSRNGQELLAPLAIGLTLAVIHFASMGATGTSVNPARSIGPGVFAGAEAIKDLWLFILAPVIGAAIAGLLYPLVFGRDRARVPGSGLVLSRRTPAAAPSYPEGYQWQPTGYPQQWGAPQGYPQQYPPAAGQPQWQADQWQGDQRQGDQWQQGQQPQAGQAGQEWQGQHIGEYPEDAGFWQADQPQAPAEQPYSPQAFPPAPTEPYWSQQLPEEWNPPAEDTEHTQIRPPEENQ